MVCFCCDQQMPRIEIIANNHCDEQEVPVDVIVTNYNNYYNQATGLLKIAFITGMIMAYLISNPQFNI